jgi:hypothetical protein
MAPERGRTGRVARVGGSGFFRLSCRPHEHARPFGVPTLCCRTLASRLAPAQPEGPDDMGDGGQVGGTLAPETPDIPSLAISTLPRQTPKVGAVCGNSARTVLCGGRSVMSVPTALDTPNRHCVERSNPRDDRRRCAGFFIQGWRAAASAVKPGSADRFRFSPRSPETGCVRTT